MHENSALYKIIDSMHLVHLFYYWSTIFLLARSGMDALLCDLTVLPAVLYCNRLRDAMQCDLTVLPAVLYCNLLRDATQCVLNTFCFDKMQNLRTIVGNRDIFQF